MAAQQEEVARRFGGSSRFSIVAMAPVRRRPAVAESFASIAPTSSLRTAFEFGRGLTPLGGQRELELPAIRRERLSRMINPFSSKFCTIRLR